MENTGVPADPPPNSGEPHPNQPNSHQPTPYQPNPYRPDSYQPPPVSPYARPTENPAPGSYGGAPAQPYGAPPPQLYGAPPTQPAPYLYGEQPVWPGAAPPKRTSRWLIPSIVIFAVVVLGCVSGVGILIVRAADRAAATADTDPTRLDGLPGSGSSDAPLPESTEAVPAGPRAATYPVREDEDLDRVCDQWYYPTSPKYAGAALHQISIGVVSDRTSKSRFMNKFVAPYSLGTAAQNAWRAENPAKSQLMACVDLVSVGGQAKKCKYTDPKPDTVALRRGNYQLRLFEVATGRKLIDKKLVGEDEECPSMVFVGTDKTIYSKPTDRQLYELLRPYVVKKM